jgi:hypothetical protein
LHALIQDACEENWKIGAKVPDLPIKQNKMLPTEEKSNLNITIMEFQEQVLPGLRWSHILKTGSDPPAATIEELSPPISRQFNAFPQTYKWYMPCNTFEAIYIINCMEILH